jgi:hypothetical protein
MILRTVNLIICCLKLKIFAKLILNSSQFQKIKRKIVIILIEAAINKH